MVTIKKGMESVQINFSGNTAELFQNAMVQALGLPDNPVALCDGDEVEDTSQIVDGDTIVIEQRATDKGC